MKQVIFIGGTSFSGSTLLQFMLANDPKGFSCGEVAWLFRPQRPDQINRLCACGDQQCSVWSTVLKAGEENLYQTIFQLFPEVEFVIDSSKSPYWIQYQQRILQKQGIGVKHLLIWKTPLEFAYSLKKRNRSEPWAQTWIKSHRLYFTLIKEWRAVKYSSLTQNHRLLQQLCAYLDIPYFAGKEEYWGKKHHTLGGNYSARLHLQTEQDANAYVSQSFDKSRMETYRTIYTKDVEDLTLKQEVEEQMINSVSLQRIQDTLTSYDIANESDPNTALASSLAYSKVNVSLRHLKNSTKSMLFRYRFNRKHKG